ncbi:MAG: hypothetical protein BV457_05985 [Thermoplasmata archaeon M9B1D]|nr:MAG: hypothetical protein BV457_05985 [Thermoplasmata archaeon M9B1D]
MAGIKVPQHKIFKITSTQLKYANYNLNITLKDAFDLEELVPLFQSQAFRSIANILNKEPNNVKYTEKVLAITFDDMLLFKEINNRDIIVNGEKYKRFVGTTGGLKNNTLLFVNENIYDELFEISECGRNKNIPIIPAKLEAYRALFFSSSQQLPNPNGILVVKDCITKYIDTIISIDDSEDGEPKSEILENVELENNVSDGFNLCTIEYMKRASKYLGLEYIANGLCLRNAWLKGMLYAFPIIEFIKKYADDNYMIEDIWGNMIDIRNVEMIITESSLKLWNSYKSIDDYISNYKKYGYTFSTTKIISNHLEDERELNYQYLQSYDFDDNDIEELCKPTVEYLKKSMGGGYKETLEFLGINGNLNDNSWQQALYTNEYMIKDPYIVDCVHRMIKQKINNAKIGKLKVNGNYQLASGDPFALMQSICGLEITGLLKAEEVYSKYWIDNNVDDIVIFRSPMTSHNNIRRCNIINNEDVLYWYQYMYGVMIINGFDSFCMAENGCDWDGDLLYSTNNEVLLRKHIKLPAISCSQRKANKIIPTEEDILKSNVNGMDNKVGSITNRVTAMKEVQSKFDKGSREYKEIDYRMACGQLYQQNELDKIKGIVFKPMPNNWYNISSCKDDFSKSICANKKPYFFIYIYNNVKSEYKKYIKSNEDKCMTKFFCTIDELSTKENKTEEELNFLEWYYKGMPIGNNPCAMNKICWHIEKEFDGYKNLLKANGNFDYNILKVKRRCSEKHRDEIKSLLKEYVKKISDYKTNKIRSDKNDEDRKVQRFSMKKYFYNKAKEICPDDNERLNIVLDLCYGYKNNKQFCYDTIGDLIIKRLEELKNANNE